MRPRVVIDTNVLVSGIAYPDGAPGKIVAAWRTGSLDLVLSEHILGEVRRVLPKLNHRLRWTDREMADFVDCLALSVEVVEVKETATDPALRDPMDQPVLATLVRSRADFLITGDGDLLALASSYPVMRPAQFWARFGQ